MSSDNVTPIRPDPPEPESRSGQLPAGAHGPISVWVDLVKPREFEYYYHIKAECPGEVGAYVRYRGHKADLIGAPYGSAGSFLIHRGQFIPET